MNYRLVAKYLALFAYALAGLMIPSVLWGVYFKEWHAVAAFGYSIAGALAVGGLFTAWGYNAPQVMFQREALGLVTFSWIFSAFIGAMPYVFGGYLGPVDAYFESMSGFTTTGSTVITDIEAAPKCLLFWRSLTQWLGGMGIVVMFIAVLPYLGAGGKQLFKSEAPGPDPRGLSPRIKNTASTLYKIYLGLTALQTGALMAAGLDFYQALTHTLATLATGGFSTLQGSIGGFDSVAVEIIIIVFMGCAGTNFAIFFAMLRNRDWKTPFRDTEWRVYLGILVVATLLVTLNLMYGAHQPTEADPDPEGYGLGKALRYASFQVMSLMTTTGFGTDNFDAWPHFSRMLMIVLMFIGASAGSTSGGMKVVRLVVLAKMAYWRLEYTFRPKTIRAVRVGNDVVNDEVQRMVYAFFVLQVLWLVIGSLIMSGLGLPFQTAMTSVVATLNNIGPGLELVGATEDFALIPDLGKIFLCLCMVLGRLELFSVCVLFIPSFWRHS